MTIAEHLFLVPLDIQSRPMGGTGFGGATLLNHISADRVSIRKQFLKNCVAMLTLKRTMRLQ